MELRATAFGSVLRGTSAGMRDWNAGPPNACASPVVNESTRMYGRRTVSVKTSAVRISAQTIWSVCEAISMWRRS